MFQRSSGLKPYVELFYSFFKYVNPSDTEATCPLSKCGHYTYNHATAKCGSVNTAPDFIFLVNTFDGGYIKEKYRSSETFKANRNTDLSLTNTDTCIKCQTSGGLVEVKNVHWSFYGSCDTKLPAIDYTLTSTNSYESISQKS